MYLPLCQTAMTADRAAHSSHLLAIAICLSTGTLRKMGARPSSLYQGGKVNVADEGVAFT